MLILWNYEEFQNEILIEIEISDFNQFQNEILKLGGQKGNFLFDHNLFMRFESEIPDFKFFHRTKLEVVGIQILKIPHFDPEILKFYLRISCIFYEILENSTEFSRIYIENGMILWIILNP